MEKYIIVSQLLERNLEYKINSYINKGYLPTGGVGFNPKTNMLMQAMLLKEKKPSRVDMGPM